MSVIAACWRGCGIRSGMPLSSTQRPGAVRSNLTFPRYVAGWACTYRHFEASYISRPPRARSRWPESAEFLPSAMRDRELLTASANRPCPDSVDDAERGQPFRATHRSDAPFAVRCTNCSSRSGAWRRIALTSFQILCFEVHPSWTNVLGRCAAFM